MKNRIIIVISCGMNCPNFRVRWNGDISKTYKLACDLTGQTIAHISTKSPYSIPEKYQAFPEWCPLKKQP